MKGLLKKHLGNWDLFRAALLEYRNVPRSDGISATQMMFGRRQRTRLPSLPQAHDSIPEDERARVHQEREEKPEPKQEKQVEFLKGERVRVQDPFTKEWTIHGTIQEKMNERTFKIMRDNGKLILRNRKFIKRCTDSKIDVSLNESNDSADTGVRRSERLKKKVSFQRM